MIGLAAIVASADIDDGVAARRQNAINRVAVGADVHDGRAVVEARMIWIMAAPARQQASISSATCWGVIGWCGVFDFAGEPPVTAAQMMSGFMPALPLRQAAGP